MEVDFPSRGSFRRGRYDSSSESTEDDEDQSCDAIHELMELEHYGNEEEQPRNKISNEILEEDDDDEEQRRKNVINVFLDKDGNEEQPRTIVSEFLEDDNAKQTRDNFNELLEDGDEYGDEEQKRDTMNQLLEDDQRIRDKLKEDEERTRDKLKELLLDDDNESVAEDAQSRYTSDGSQDFLGWPSRRSSMASGASQTDDMNDIDDSEYMRESQDLQRYEPPPNQFDYRTDSDYGDDDATAATGAGTVNVEFPTDRTPFRRKSIDSHQSIGTSVSGYNTGGSGDENDALTANSSIGMANMYSSNNSRDGLMRQSSLNSLGSINTGNNTGDRTSTGTTGSRGGGLARRKSSRSNMDGHRRSSLDTIDSNQSMSSLRKSLEKKDQPTKPPRRKSKEAEIVRQPSLTQLHDSFVSALPLLGWDKESDSDCNSALMGGNHHALGRSGRSSAFGNSVVASGTSNGSGMGRLKLPMSSSVSMAGSVTSSLKASQIDGYGPYNNDTTDGLFLGFRDRGSVVPNNNNNLRTSLGPNMENNNEPQGMNRQDLAMLMMEEEYDPRKPWRKAPPGGGTVLMPVKQKDNDGNGGVGGIMGRRASGIGTRSSFTSDMSFGDVLLQEMEQQHTGPMHISTTSGSSPHEQAPAATEEEEATTSAPPPKKRGMTAAQALAKMGASPEEDQEGDDALPAETIAAKTHPPNTAEKDLAAIIQESDDEMTSFRMSKMYSVTSSLGDDDDGSELTELRQAQEALFPIGEGPESVISSEVSFERREKPTVQLTASLTSADDAPVEDEPTPALKSKGMRWSMVKDLSSMDIVQKEQPHDRYSKDPQLSPLREIRSDEEDQLQTTEKGRKLMHDLSNSSQLLALDLSELDDLPTSVTGNDPFRKSLRSLGIKDDDSVSYSDIDVEQGVPQPSIKMCMTVRNSVIEREFSTLQMADVEFGETKPNEDITLHELLEGPGGNGNNYLHESEHNPLNDSLRSGGHSATRSSSTKKSSKRTGSTLSGEARRFKKGMMNQTSKLDTKATKRLRRKNKRLWKFCVWNCRKITVCLVLSLCILAGIAALAWWGATKVAGGDSDDEAQEFQVQEDDSGGVNANENSVAPTGPESKQWPPVTESGRIPPPPLLEGGPTQYPSMPPSPEGVRVVVDASSPSSTPPLPTNKSYVPSSSPSNYITSPTSAQSPEQVLSFPPTSEQVLSFPPTSVTLSYSNGPSSRHPSTTPTYYMSTVVATSNYTNTTIPYSYTESEQLTPSFTPSESPSPSYINSNINKTFTSSSSNETNTTSSIAPSFQPSASTAPPVNSSSNIVDAPSFQPNSSMAPTANTASYIAGAPSFQPSSSMAPTINNAPYIAYAPSFQPSSSMAPTINNTPYIAYAPSFQPSSSMAPTVSTTLENSSISSNNTLLENPSSVAFSSFPSSSPSSNASFIEPSVGNSSFSSTPPSNLSFIDSMLGNAVPSSILMNNQSSSVAFSDVESVYTTVQAISGAKQFEYAGSSVSMSPTGEFIAVGSKGADNILVERTGLVRVYQRNSKDVYSPLGVDSMFGAATGDEFGASVSISNDGQRVAVGARSSSSPDKQKHGEVKIFQYSEASNSWFLLGSSVQGLEEKDRFGFSVSLSGDGQRVAVGAPRGNGGTGSASLHTFNGLDWILIGDIVVGNDVGDRAGFSVSLSNDGSTLAVGAFTSSTSDLTNSGSVSVYRLDGTSSLVKHGQTLVGTSSEAQLGHSVALSGDGMRLIVGSNGFGTATASKLGLCQVHELIDQNDWIPIVALIGDESEEAGSHVSISQNGNAVSCSKKSLVDGVVQGTVVILEENGSQWDIVDAVTSSYGNSTSFGTSVSLTEDGKTILAGAPTDSSDTGFFELLASKLE